MRGGALGGEAEAERPSPLPLDPRDQGLTLFGST